MPSMFPFLVRCSEFRLRNRHCTAFREMRFSRRGHPARFALISSHWPAAETCFFLFIMLLQVENRKLLSFSHMVWSALSCGRSLLLLSVYFRGEMIYRCLAPVAGNLGVRGEKAAFATSVYLLTTPRFALARLTQSKLFLDLDHAATHRRE